MTTPLIPKLPKYKRYGLGDVFEQGKQSLGQLFNPEGKPQRKKSSMKPR